ncbi:hypothetical protein BROUX41_003344 [Berkeleyomyces rouxiae]|uniref:uncharacterized protein n=1 Tax=Berkeleyomyces rouxiae TaxID=2035830 RepID=UPI003B829AA8
MLPPIDEAILENHPDFKALYTTLTTVVLNSDGTSVSRSDGTERQRLRDELDQHRFKEARQHLLSHAVTGALSQEPNSQPWDTTTSARRDPKAAISTSQSLPNDALDLLLLLPSIITPPEPLSAETTSLLLSSPPFSDLASILPLCTPLISANLEASALDLARVAHPDTAPSHLQRSISNLPATVASLQASLSQQKSELAKARLSTCSNVVDVLEQRMQVLTQLVRALEAKHGAIARSAEHTAAELALQAQKAEAEASMALHKIHKEVYSQEVCSALTNYGRHLRDARIRLKEAIQARKMELAEYGVGVEGQEDKEVRMREVAESYVDVSRKLDEVESDLERLNRSVG